MISHTMSPDCDQTGKRIGLGSCLRNYPRYSCARLIFICLRIIPLKRCPPFALMLPPLLRVVIPGRLLRRLQDKSCRSRADVIFTTAVLKGMSKSSPSPMIGSLRSTNGWAICFPKRCVYRFSSICTEKEVSRSMGYRRVACGW